jgi:SH3-like domain-containing protein
VHAENAVQLRREPEKGADVVGELGPGIFVPLLDVTDDGLWLKIGLDTIGWVAGVDVSLSGDILTNNTTMPTRQAILQADTAVNVRSGPGTRNKVLGRLKPGQVVAVLGWNDEGTWMRIPFNAGEGWVNGETVIIAAGPTPTPEATAEATPEP